MYTTNDVTSCWYVYAGYFDENFIFLFIYISVILATRKSADDTLNVLRILLERGCKELINAPDSLGNTPLHALIVRYALEEAK